MGTGKAEPDYWAAEPSSSLATVLYEVGAVTEEAARLCLSRLAAQDASYSTLF